ncbi:44685_t:CDS:2 [Gigaspora margarita]|uniref:44685_t:CDS:1 n=1 Tax=Gigaspora margarita TaxID=4874 RepID=A0ABN7V4M7_GIGMA|nr:44685_t:CDS:2 [Gigaspora margarita]
MAKWEEKEGIIKDNKRKPQATKEISDSKIANTNGKKEREQKKPRPSIRR